MNRLVVAGFVCVDLIPRFSNDPSEPIERVLRPGGMVNIDAVTVASGGCVANTGIAAAKLGASVAFCAKVGQDSLGSLLMDLLAPHGDTQGVQRTPDQATGSTVVLAPRGSDRQFLTCGGANDTFGARDIDFGLLRPGDLFHFGYPPLMRGLATDGGHQLATIMQRAREAGATTALDLSLPDLGAPAGQADWVRLMQHVLPHVDLFLPSIEEACFALNPARYREARAQLDGQDFAEAFPAEEFPALAERALQWGCGVAALKSGARGWYLRTGPLARLQAFRGPPLADTATWADRSWWAPAYRAAGIAGATGAGDASIAGFLTALLRGLDAPACLCRANAAGLASLAAPDAVGGLTGWSQLETITSTLRPRTLDLPGWRRRADGVYEPV